jgi:acyl carrier protein
MELEKEFSISIPEEEAEKLASGTVQQIADYVVKKLRV